MKPKSMLKTSEAVKQVRTSEIKRANMHDLMFIIIPDLSGSVMTDKLREHFVHVIGKRLRTLQGKYSPVETVRAMVAWCGEPPAAPEWCEKWVYIKNRKRFYNMESKEEYKRDGFNRLNKRRLPKHDEIVNKREGLSTYVLNNNWLKCVDSYAYIPNEDAFVTLDSGLEVCNTFDPNSVPHEAIVFTNMGLKTIDRIKQHIGYIAGTPERADALTQWLAHQVQRPGDIVGWSPLIVGKIMDREFLPRLLGCVIGYKNVGTETSMQVRTKMHNGWANDKAVTVFYELRGLARYPEEAAVELERYITDDNVKIHARGSLPVTVPNTTNYLAFTRYYGNVCETTGCWWILPTTPEALEAYKKAVGDDSGKYYGSLNHAAEWHMSEVRRWLLEYPIADAMYGYVVNENDFLNDI